MCTLIAVLNAAAWSILVPPFQGRDEVDHFAYVSQLAQTQTLPEGGTEGGNYSPEETIVLEALHYPTVRFQPGTPSITSEGEQRNLINDVNVKGSLEGSGEAGVATSEPPLYYAIETIPYMLGEGNILAQLQLMRLLGALFGGLTALFIFLFLRELLPSVPWAATVGALCVALQPLFAFTSGSLNPDTMLFAIVAGLFLCLARAFKRGLTRRLAIALGLLIAIGFITKLNFVGVAAGVFLGLLLLAVREARSHGLRSLLSPAIAAGIGAAPVVLYALRNALSGRPTFGIASLGTSFLAPKSLAHVFSYVWQMYLPHLPGMTHYFTGITPYKDVWFDRSVGLYGWMDTTFPAWVENLALIPATAIVLLCGRELVLQRDALRARLAEFSVYVTVSLGVLLMIGISSYFSDVLQRSYSFGEPRYLLPLLPLVGAVIVLAVRGAGRRWAPVVGAAMVLLFLGHDIFSQLQVVARYYG